jgi:ketosteroid isomerase-like protein
MFTAPDGKMVMDDGKYATVWKKQVDGSWKLAVDMFNSNMPLPLHR